MCPTFFSSLKTPAQTERHVSHMQHQFHHNNTAIHSRRHCLVSRAGRIVVVDSATLWWEV